MAVASIPNFVDVDLSFTPIPGSNDIGVLRNTNAIQNSIINLVLMMNGDVPYHSDIGSPVYYFLFSNFNVASLNALQSEIRNMLTQYEPRAQINSVVIDEQPDSNALNITINFTPINTAIPATITIPFARTR
jgi:phage baseplate assembly protein W